VTADHLARVRKNNTLLVWNESGIAVVQIFSDKINSDTV